uniref:Fer2_2 domain-containing protein n=1 Tax=Macrostomum lignano TaxID=282301 RepID=A0A1I8FFC3_9PLAT
FLETAAPEQMLIDFFRDILELKGSKVSCREAACGACIVCVTYKHPGTATSRAALATRRTATPRSSPAVADNYGQPVRLLFTRFRHVVHVALFSQLLNNPKPTEAEVEHFFDGNICRCTGYRPILDSMKLFAKDCKAKGA